MTSAALVLGSLLSEKCPGIYGNPYLGGHWPTPKQALFLAAHRVVQQDNPGKIYEALFGGAAGGGKSDALLMGAAQTAFLYPGSSSVLIRTSSKDLSEPGALLFRARQWWLPAGVHFNANQSIFTFPNGSTVKFAHHGHVRDDEHFQSAEYQFAGFDELTHWPDIMAYDWVRSRLRRGATNDTPMRLLSASNPGGPGHTWVRLRFLGGINPSTGMYEEAVHPYFPATIWDNPHLDREAYIASLSEMYDPTRREQLLHGDWEARTPGDYYRSEWFGELLDPELDTWPATECRRVRWWDLAASSNKRNARTAGVRMAQHASGVRAIEHAVAFWKTPGDRDEAIVQQAVLDGRGVMQGFEVEGGSGGITQVLSLEKRLREQGLRCEYRRPKSDLSPLEALLIVANPRSDVGKQTRAMPVSSCLRRGAQRRGEGVPPSGASPWFGEDSECAVEEEKDGLRLFSGLWTADYLEEMELFYTPGFRCDFSDATAAAWSYLEAHPFGTRIPISIEKQAEAAGSEQHDLHPTDRGSRTRGAKTRAGHWRP